MLLFLALACKHADTDDTDVGETDTLVETDTTGPDRTAAFEAIREAVATDLLQNDATGASVAIWYDGEVIFAEGFGKRDPDAEDPVAPTTLFQIGSDTKKLTAIAVLREVEAGHLSLDDTLSEALPDLHFAKDAGWTDAITVHQLISHQGGLYDYTPWDDAPADSELANRAYGTFAADEWAMAPGGSFWNYSNANFSIAGLIAEEHAGRPYADLLEDDVFAPLGMTRTFARQSEVEADGDYAVGFGVGIIGDFDSFVPLNSDIDYTYGAVAMADQPDNGFTRPAGLVWSTATDQVKLAAFLIDGDQSVLSDEMRAGITTPHVPLSTVVSGQSYGYGLMILDGWYGGSTSYYATPLWTHGGNTLTMTSGFYVLPEQRLAVSILSNGYGDDFSGTAATALLQLADLPEPSNPPAPPPPATNLDTYAGDYVDTYGIGRMTFGWDGTHVTIDLPDLEAAGHRVGVNLVSAYQDVFLVTIDGGQYDLEFEDGPDGAPRQYVHNRSFVGTKVSDPQAMRTPIAARWSPRGSALPTSIAPLIHRPTP
jgi:CubicO group peptidase (beta-lactamase class C family)